MTQSYKLPTKQQFLVLLLLLTLFILISLNFSMDQTQVDSETWVQNDEISEISVPLTARIVNDETSETTIHFDNKIENDEVAKNLTSSWLDYNKNWDGEVLIDTKPAKVTLTDNYRMKMRSKGLHPLNLQYKRLRDRVERIDEYCNISISDKESEFKINGFYSILYDDKSQLLQCLVQKVASSCWSKVFSELVGLEMRKLLNPNDKLWQKISLIYNMKDSKQTARRFQTYTKFLFSRQPFQRLLSAHREKFQGKEHGFKKGSAPRIITAVYLSNYSAEFISQTREKLKRRIISASSSEVVRQIARLNEDPRKFNITLLEFLKYIIIKSKTTGAHNLDFHWRPITLVCNPCAIKYDVIGRFETLSEDSQAILDFVHPNIPELKYKFPIRDSKVTAINCSEAFRKIPLEVRRSLYDIYRDDFLLFGYEYNEDESANLC